MTKIRKGPILSLSSCMLRDLLATGRDFSDLTFIIDVGDPADLDVDEWLWLVGDEPRAPQCMLVMDEREAEFCARAARGDEAEAERLRLGLSRGCVRYGLSKA